MKSFISLKLLSPFEQLLEESGWELVPYYQDNVLVGYLLKPKSKDGK